MHPPFGYAMFYLSSVAPTKDYVDRVTRRMTPRVTTGQIYWGAVPFVLLQLIMVSLIIIFPGIVSGGLAKKAAVNIDQMQIQIPNAEPGSEAPLEGSGSEADKPGSGLPMPPDAGDDDDAKAIE